MKTTLGLALTALLLTACPPSERCSPDPLEAFDDAWRRWGVEGLPMRDCDAAALLEVRELAQQQLKSAEGTTPRRAQTECPL